jgi:hypothetical protein
MVLNSSEKTLEQEPKAQGGDVFSELFNTISLFILLKKNSPKEPHLDQNHSCPLTKSVCSRYKASAIHLINCIEKQRLFFEYGEKHVTFMVQRPL